MTGGSVGNRSGPLPSPGSSGGAAMNRRSFPMNPDPVQEVGGSGRAMSAVRPPGRHRDSQGIAP